MQQANLYRIPRMETKKSPLTARGLAVGIIGLIIITASSMYVALRMGALPWPTVFVTVLSMAVLGKAKGSTLEEINCTHTLMSAGAMVAGGLAFTLPGLWMTDPSAELSLISVLAISVTGAVLGTLFTIIFRRSFIEKEKLRTIRSSRERKEKARRCSSPPLGPLRCSHSSGMDWGRSPLFSASMAEARFSRLYQYGYPRWLWESERS